MIKRPDFDASRRGFLKTAAAAGGTVLAGQALAQDAMLQALIEQNQSSEFGQGFDSASRTILMPKASLPTLSPATVQHTEQAIGAVRGDRRRAAAGPRSRAPTGCGSATAIPRWSRCASG